MIQRPDHPQLISGKDCHGGGGLDAVHTDLLSINVIVIFTREIKY